LAQLGKPVFAGLPVGAWLYPRTRGLSAPLGSTLARSKRLIVAARGRSFACAAGLPKPRSNMAFAADTRVPAATFLSCMMSASTWIAARPYARARALMSSGVSSVFMENRVGDEEKRINWVWGAGVNYKKA
jgi:hypothetical protein